MTSELAHRVANRYITAELLTKQWLMGVRRGWLSLLKPQIHDWPDVFKAFDRLIQFVDNLEDQVLFVRRGPYSSPPPMTGAPNPEGKALRTAFKNLKSALSDQRSAAKFWYEQATGTGSLPITYDTPRFRGQGKEDGEKMFLLYRDNFAGTLDTHIKTKKNPAKGQWNSTRSAEITELLDRVLEILRDDAKRISEHSKNHPDERLVIEEPAFKEFDIHGMKVVVDDRTVSAAEILRYVKHLEAAYDALKRKGVKSAWYGTVFIQCETCGGENQYGANLGVGGHYKIGPDTVGVFVRPSSFIVELMAHELGHRYWYKQMSQAQRAKFESLVKTKPSRAEVGKPISRSALTKKDVDDIAELADKLFRPLGPAIEKFRHVLTTSEVTDQHGNFEDMLDEYKNLSQVLQKFLGFDPIYSLVWERFKGPLKVTYGSAPEYTSRREHVDALLKRYLASSRKFSKINISGEWLEFIKKKNEAEVLKNLDAKRGLLDEIEGDLSTLMRELYKLAEDIAKDTPQVSPVSDYGGNSISEAWAEVFARYVLGGDMDRDQVESFKTVLRGASEKSGQLGNGQFSRWRG